MRLAALLLLAATAWAGVVADVRRLLYAGDPVAAERAAVAYRNRNGETAEFLAAWSWLGRGALSAKDYAAASRYASETQAKAVALLKKRPLDADRDLPEALGAAIEVQVQTAAATGERGQAVVFLKGELGKYGSTSIAARLHKNLNLLTLEGKPAPEIERLEWLGPRPLGLAGYRGRVVLLFFWAHWCGDCKAEAPVLVELQKAYPQLVILGPTRRYGYVAGGAEANAAEELKYIDSVRREFYPLAPELPVPVSERTFMNYGASTTPTLVLVDRNGVVRLYHPGAMTVGELSKAVSTAMQSPVRK